MAAKKPKIGPASKVRLQFQLKLVDGTMVDQTQPGEKFEFVIGDGTLVEGLEQRLLDLQADSAVTFNIPADEGVYGFPDPEYVRSLPRSDFPGSIELKPGNLVGFDLPNGDEILGVIQDSDDENVTVDFNHPLIGRDFVFEVVIESVEDA